MTTKATKVTSQMVLDLQYQVPLQQQKNLHMEAKKLELEKTKLELEIEVLRVQNWESTWRHPPPLNTSVGTPLMTLENLPTDSRFGKSILTLENL